MRLMFIMVFVAQSSRAEFPVSWPDDMPCGESAFLEPILELGAELGRVSSFKTEPIETDPNDDATVEVCRTLTLLDGSGYSIVFRHARPPGAPPCLCSPFAVAVPVPAVVARPRRVLLLACRERRT